MNIASGASHGLRYVAETTPGITPATPAMVEFNHTSCGLTLSRDSFQSQNLKDNRQISGMRLGANKIQGGINIELAYGEYDAFLQAALAGEWAGNVLKAGKQRHSFTLERAFADIGQYGVYTGCYCNKLSLSIKPNAIVTGTFDLIGFGSRYAATPLTASVTHALDNPAFDAFSGELEEGGTAIAVVTGIELTLDNGIQPQYVIGSRDAAFVTFGKSQCSGTLTAFFADAALVSKFIDETATSLKLTLGDGASQSYQIELPNIRYTGADNPAQNDGPISVTMPFTALLDAGAGSQIQITRIP